MVEYGLARVLPPAPTRTTTCGGATDDRSSVRDFLHPTGKGGFRRFEPVTVRSSGGDMQGGMPRGRVSTRTYPPRISEWAHHANNGLGHGPDSTSASGSVSRSSATSERPSATRDNSKQTVPIRGSRIPGADGNAGLQLMSNTNPRRRRGVVGSLETMPRTVRAIRLHG